MQSYPEKSDPAITDTRLMQMLIESTKKSNKMDLYKKLKKQSKENAAYIVSHNNQSSGIPRAVYDTDFIYRTLGDMHACGLLTDKEYCLCVAAPLLETASEREYKSCTIDQNEIMTVNLEEKGEKK